MDEWTIRSIIRQVLRGLTYAHSKGVAHRDIKPENILCGITPQGPFRIMLSDFGDSAISGRGRMKSNVGTRFYRPPYVHMLSPRKAILTFLSECHTPGQGHDLSVDIWAVGMLALQLFLGYEEFPELDSVVFNNQKEIDTYVQSIFSVLSHHSLISEAGEGFIRGCLAYDSKKRPTARRAFQHDWLQKPRADREMFKELESNNSLSWKPQRVKFPVIEDLTAAPLAENTLESEGVGAPQQTVSSHFVDYKEAGARARGAQRTQHGEIAWPTLQSGLNPHLASTKRKGFVADRERGKREGSSFYQFG